MAHAFIFRYGLRGLVVVGGLVCWLVPGVVWLAAASAEPAPFIPGRDDQNGTRPARPVSAESPVSAFPGQSRQSGEDVAAGQGIPTGLPPAFPNADTPVEGPMLQPAVSGSPAWADLARLREHANPRDYARALTLWPLTPVQEQDLQRVFADACAHADPSVARNARNALRDLPREQVFAYVMRVLSWGDADAVSAVDCVLPEIGPDIAPLLRATLETEAETERHRCVAAWALGRSGTTIGVDLLCRYALDASGDLPRFCREALRRLRAPEAAAVWMELLENRPGEAGPEAIAALDALDTIEAGEWIFEAACGRKGVGRYLEEEAVRCIARKPAMRAVPALIAVLEQNRGMREAAAKALRQVTGQPIGSDPALWRAWYEEETGIILPPPPPPPGKSPAEAVTPPPLEFPAELPPLMPTDGTVGAGRDHPDGDQTRQPAPARNPKSVRRRS